MTKILLLIFGLLQTTICYAAKPHEWQIDFQEAASPVMAELHHFHNFLLIISAAIVLFVLLLLIYVMYRFSAKRNPIPATFTHNIAIEVIWTVIPIIILIIIAIPSFRILKDAEHSPTPDVTIKVVGSQWFWTYSYPDNGNIEFDSNMIQDKDLKPGQLRLLEVDNRLIVPQGAVVKFLITASDVLHSFGVPSLGIKNRCSPWKGKPRLDENRQTRCLLWAMFRIMRGKPWFYAYRH
jgi:cytochrome c oxidase subunit 2